ncbi:MAG: helix-turn-helix transcriptional regulator [Chloroflexi bacterium]|nr:helix-turn-helix transcriptional regulator [Chloroflexota bacterium]
MSIKAQVSLRTRKLGVLIRDARLAARLKVSDCAAAIGISGGVFRAYEEGRRAPSLPELEVLAYFLHIPIQRFWSKDATSDDAPPTVTLDLPALVGIRQRLIGALLRQEREHAGFSIKVLAEQAGLPASRVKSYELGERPIPIPELEGLLGILNGRVEVFFDETGPIGLWMKQQKAMHDFLLLPPELQTFVCKPVNRPYLELALTLSGLSTEKLRSVAEGLLDITL